MVYGGHSYAFPAKGSGRRPQARLCTTRLHNGQTTSHTAPSNFKIEMFVVRVGDWGWYMLLDCDDPLAVHKFCSMLPAFVFEARPVVPVMDAVRVELEAIAFRDGLKGK